MAKVPLQTMFGAIVFILGVLLLLKTTGIYDTGELLMYIPSLFILLELYVFWRSGFSDVVRSIILIVVFAAIQLLILDFISWENIVTGFTALGDVSIND